MKRFETGKRITFILNERYETGGRETCQNIYTNSGKMMRGRTKAMKIGKASAEEQNRFREQN